ncbi:cytochrome b/b6 domain-containing protein [Rhodoferax sp.]|uniref:cytochrome b/b6 domain-containing protein n=1 Tax=Rhodoferax sp. TaxID=50421 RepID=UPI002601E526|nr:cytochrome b/b6 domain-containing protein [Rhodoferax sp.]MDD2809601.1 cytochrome b/b6 domain-containing protein [Rhodoferax sp.]MDD4944248.1 cytochrome b/b6 domain-containing protein [Rhodoferax sp.]
MRFNVRVWDAPTRLFHWLLVIAVVSLVVTANLGGSAMIWHFRLGYGVLSLLLFRITWGFVGGYWSRFKTFIFHPSVIFNYLKGKGSSLESIGHNPIGSLSVMAMLLFLALQVTTGLMSDDEILNSGPLTRFVSSEWVALSTTYHKNIGKVVLLFLIVTHTIAIAFYYFKKQQNLVKAMITGDKTLDVEVTQSTDTHVDRLRAVLILTACVFIVFFTLSYLER